MLRSFSVSCCWWLLQGMWGGGVGLCMVGPLLRCDLLWVCFARMAGLCLRCPVGNWHLVCSYWCSLCVCVASVVFLLCGQGPGVSVMACPLVVLYLACCCVGWSWAGVPSLLVSAPALRVARACFCARPGCGPVLLRRGRIFFWRCAWAACCVWDIGLFWS